MVVARVGRGDGVGGGGGWRDIKLVEEHEERERNEWWARPIVWAWKVYLEWVDGGGDGGWWRGGGQGVG